MSTHRIVLVSLLVASACLGLAAAYADGSWRDLWLNLLAGAVGVAFIVLFDVLFERSEARDGLADKLGTIDFAAPGVLKSDRYFVEWPGIASIRRRSSSGAGSSTSSTPRASSTTISARAPREPPPVRPCDGRVPPRHGALGRREKPTSPVYAFEGITELTPENAGRLVSELQEFVGFYREQCERYGVAIPASHTGS